MAQLAYEHDRHNYTSLSKFEKAQKLSMIIEKHQIATMQDAMSKMRGEERVLSALEKEEEYAQIEAPYWAERRRPLARDRDLRLVYRIDDLAEYRKQAQKLSKQPRTLWPSVETAYRLFVSIVVIAIFAALYAVAYHEATQTRDRAKAQAERSLVMQSNMERQRALMRQIQKISQTRLTQP